MASFLVTGAAGFIGYHVCRSLLERGDRVVGIDNLNSYYEVSLKEARLALLRDRPGFAFSMLDLADRAGMETCFAAGNFERVIHLGAQAGVRYSVTNPHVYVDSNIVGFLHVLEGCRQTGVQHLVFASSSSVYGASTKTPFSTRDNVDHPLSLYAATKKSNELMAHVYSHLYGLAVTGLRFFTVYGPWGRPDMAPFLFTRAILAGKPIGVFNHGKMRRDFTYIDDIVEGVIRAADRMPADDPAGNKLPYRIYNIGNHQPVELLRFIEVLEDCLGKRAIKNLLPMQLGDVPETCADVEDLARDVGFRPSTPLEVGLRKFVEWYRGYYKDA